MSTITTPPADVEVVRLDPSGRTGLVTGRPAAPAGPTRCASPGPGPRPAVLDVDADAVAALGDEVGATPPAVDLSDVESIDALDGGYGVAHRLSNPGHAR